MATLEMLQSSIYHEEQQKGSMLCAQHALNSLLQGNYFTAPDLSDIARNLDVLEHSYDESHTSSTNMDDTGFFSVQVLDNALKVWGLNLSRWRGEEMRPYQNHPHTQLAFILNLEQHWFTLRRFGHAEPNIENDPGYGHWFNLNSFLPAPEWVGNLYLGMVLQQAEADGYSVFAVTQADPSAHLALPRTEADDIASALLEPISASHTSPQSLSYVKSAPGPSTSTAKKSDEIDGLQDEDYELQIALQASLANSGSDGTRYSEPPSLHRITRSSTSFPQSDSESPLNSDSGTCTPTHEQLPLASSTVSSSRRGDDLDPVAASMERNKLMLTRMKAQQEYAQRELWVENSGLDAGSLETNRQEQKRTEQEAEQLQRAIEESQKLAEEGRGLDNIHTNFGVRTPQVADHHTIDDRVYDDDDAELQAALTASLKHAPEGWTMPELLPLHSLPSIETPLRSGLQEGERDRDDVESVLSDETSTSTTETPAMESVSVDELRRRRLAKFGGSL